MQSDAKGKVKKGYNYGLNSATPFLAVDVFHPSFGSTFTSRLSLMHNSQEKGHPTMNKQLLMNRSSLMHNS
ncbi:hypothetical protein O6P43_034405 [Quillaja saponaria]|uniref:Uncharacterized protein n=1 Tax=Quillaja saponaria TaxID=32244 RepID=A0AAD7KMK8_QUISA|nr:hypothetical protein O6P43_034405 [Quillaja saponaria]